jgi:hypothetical protein
VRDFETAFPSGAGKADVAKVELVVWRSFLAMRFKHDFFPQHFTRCKRWICLDLAIKETFNIAVLKVLSAR